MEKDNKQKAYKGFDKDLKCRGFQYEIGKEYTLDGDVKICNKGFHACKYPFDVWGYYSPVDNNGNLHRYCTVTQSGEIQENGDKTASSHIHIETEIGLNGLIKAGVKFIFDKVKWADSSATNTGNSSAATNTGNSSAATNTGNRSAATNTGDRSAATNTGDWSAATNTGDWSAATNTGNRSAATNTGNWSAATNTGDWSAADVKGKESIAIVTGKESKARGVLGCWLVLTERDKDYNIVSVKAVKVDGIDIKPDTWYMLVDGKVKEVE